MYELISTVAKGLLAIPNIDPKLLLDVAELVNDEDYQAYFLEQVASGLLTLSRNSDVTAIVQRIRGLERSTMLCKVAKAALDAGNSDQGRELFVEALDATEINRYPTERAIAVLEVAQALQSSGLKTQAVAAFSRAIEAAAPAQDAGGTAGPEASGVILSAVRGLKGLGEVELARTKIGLIRLPSLRLEAEKIFL